MVIGSQCLSFKTYLEFNMQTIANLASRHFGSTHPGLNSFLEALHHSSIGSLLKELEPKEEPERQLKSHDVIHAIITPKPDAIRCHAATYMVRPNERGVLVPKQCIRAKECGSDFCKQHNVIVNQHCSVCSMNSCQDTVHKYQWEHLGTIQEPTWIFSKFEDDLKAKYLAAIENQKKKKCPKETGIKSSKPTKTAPNHSSCQPSSRQAEEASQVIIPPEVFMSLRQLSTTDTHVSSIEEEMMDHRDYSEKWKVWIDNDTQLYYMNEKDDDPLGQVMRDKLVPFRRK